MFHRYKHLISSKKWRNLIISTSILFLFAFTDKFRLHDSVEYSSSSTQLYFNGVPIPECCLATYGAHVTRERQNTLHVNPARQVVEELMEFVTFNKDICPKKKDGERLAVAIVDTARQNFRARNIIRQTWASLEKYKNWHVRTVFLMGQSEHCVNYTIADADKEAEISVEEKLLMEESEQYGDIVIGAFTDTYRNLTYKHLMGYKYILENCPETDFIIKTDDDMFVEVPAILDNRSKELRRKKASDSEQIFDLYCHHYHDSPTRDANSVNGKWFSTREEWPEDTYPPYCLGLDYAISMEWLKNIYSVRSDGGFFWVDDVFITGKLREIAEKKYNKTVNELNIAAAGKTTDQRGNPNFVKDNWKEKTAKIGWFVLLSRSNEEFESDMRRLWKRALRKAKVNTILY